MGTAITLTPSNSDLSMVKLAREIAMDIHPLETILKQYSITPQHWAELQENGRFKALLANQVEEWNGALNTHERVKLKAASMLEEWLPELNNRLHDKEEALPAKIEGGKMLTRIAAIGADASASSGGERFTVTINLGEDAKLTFEKQAPIKTIEHDATE